jgi:DNA-binding NtrC family response regulator
MADSTPGAPRRRVLVVEDEHDTLDLVAGVLEDEGYEVATASGGAAALEVVQGFTALPDGAEQAARIEAAVFLLKPFHIHDLLRLVQRYASAAAA